MMLTVSVLVIVALIVSMTWSEGLWSNLLSMLNAFFAAIIATNVFEPAADFMDGQAPSLTYFWDFLMLWLIFGFVFGILRHYRPNLDDPNPLQTACRGDRACAVWSVDRLDRRLLFHVLATYGSAGPKSLWQGVWQGSRREQFLHGSRSALVGLHAKSLGGRVCSI